MTYSKMAKILTTMLVCCAIKTSFADGLSSIGSSITSNANNQLINAINLPLPFVVTAWSMLSTYYSQNSSFAPTGIYAVNTSILAGVTSISNTSTGTLEVRYGPNAPGPMAGNGYALAPTRVSRSGNTFYVYQLPQCFTNIADSLTSLHTPQPGTPSSVFGNSNLGTNCVYAVDPYAAAVNEVQGTGNAPTRSGDASGSNGGGGVSA